jgi:chromosome segregation ATPase
MSADLVAEKYRLREQVDIFKSALEAKQAAYDLMKEACEQFKAERDALQSQLEAKDAEIAKINSDLSKKANEIESLEEHKKWADTYQKKYELANRENSQLVDALEKIANEDYRGNRPASIGIAREAIARVRGKNDPS